MKLASMSATRTLTSGSSGGVAPTFRATQLSPQSFLNSAWGFTKCVTKCGLGGAVGCLSCGTDLGCWGTCAGPKAVQCLADCI